MNFKVSAYLFIFVFIIGVIAATFSFDKFLSQAEMRDACMDKGCDNSTFYGSISKKEYYNCLCRFNINTSDLICFVNEKEAVNKTFKEVDCN